MARYKSIVEYKGGAYAGWQIQPNAITLQQVIEEKMSEALGQSIKVVASGRTDSGVHAKGQVIHFDAITTIPANNITYAVNKLLPKDIRIMDCEEVADDFHARYNAKIKTYSYSLYFSRVASPLREDTYHRLVHRIDIIRMRECADILEGTHDFKAFMASGSEVIDTVRTIYSIKLVERDDELIIFVTGNGFLYNMVRIIVGTLVAFSEKKLTTKEIYDILNKGERRLAGKTYPSNALCLIEVLYAEKI